MPGAAFAAAEDVTLRTVEEEDAAFIRDQSNHPAVREPMTMEGPRSLDVVRDQITGESEDFTSFLVCLDDDDAGVQPAYVQRGEDAPADVDAVEPVGLVMFFRIDEREGNTSFAYWLTPAVHGHGYATQATALALEYAFGHRRLRRVRARVLDTNDASIGLLEKLGFVHEGTQRKEKFVDGDPVDTRIYGLLREEWEDARESLAVDLN